MNLSPHLLLASYCMRSSACTTSASLFGALKSSQSSAPSKYVSVRTKYTKIPVARQPGRVSAISTYPITSPRLNKPTRTEAAANKIENLNNLIAEGKPIEPHMLFRAIMTTTTLEQLNDVYNIAKSSGNANATIHDAYLAHLTNLNYPYEVLRAYDELISKQELMPSATTYSTLVTAHLAVEQLDKALELFEKHKGSIVFNTRAYRSLMSHYFDVGEMRKGFAVFEDIEKSGGKPDLVLYNALLRGYRMCGFTEKVEEVYQRMLKEGIEPDEVTHTERIIVYGKTKNMEKMILRLQEMKDAGLQPTHITYNAMVWLFMKNTHFESAFAILETMSRERQLPLDMSAVNKLVIYFADRRRFEQARWLIEMAKKEGNNVSHLAHVLTPQFGIVDNKYWKDPMNKVVEWPY